MPVDLLDRIGEASRTSRRLRREEALLAVTVDVGLSTEAEVATEVVAAAAEVLKRRRLQQLECSLELHRSYGHSLILLDRFVKSLSYCFASLPSLAVTMYNL